MGEKRLWGKANFHAPPEALSTKVFPNIQKQEKFKGFLMTMASPTR
jgi:hypothetical protein